MALRVAACPRCKNPLVFGERICRKCGQTFQYGANPPPQPSYAQVVEALAAVGLPPPPGPQQQSSSPPQQQPQPQPQPRAQQSANPFGADLDHGRFEDVGDVDIPDVPGLLDSGIFKIFTPEHVDAAPVFGLDSGRFEDVGDVRAVVTPGLELAPRDEIGDVFTQPPSGLFHSDIFHTDGDAATGTMPDLELSTSASAPPRSATSTTSDAAKAKKLKRKEDDLGTIVCRCGERHRLPRCPACGTSHPDW
jgi:hypothetical protein